VDHFESGGVDHFHDGGSREVGITERDEIMEITGLGEAAYDRTRKRLLYLSRDLPPDLRDAVHDHLRSAS
jgi:hypothetical protein